MAPQIYEQYWKLTLAYTNLWDENFKKVLQIVIDFIDNNKEEKYSPQKYARLQTLVLQKTTMSNEASVRKAINQTVKLGFVDTHLSSYHQEAKDFLAAQTERKMRTLFSKVVYSNASFARSVTRNSNSQEIEFLIRTLTEIGTLSKMQIMAIMTTKIEDYPNGYLTKKELDEVVEYTEHIDFKKRKYNQVSYMWNILGKLDNLSWREDNLYFTEDIIRLFGSEQQIVRQTSSRDPYLQCLYRNQLREESSSYFGAIKCMVEKLAYPYRTLIASHIKPYASCAEAEAFDVNNGLLLCGTIDALFDKGYISFDENGVIIFSEEVNDDVQRKLTGYAIESGFLNDERKTYLSYHRQNVLKH